MVRVDLGIDTTWSDRITVKEVISSQDLAEQEVSRLNTLNDDKNCIYFAKPTRVFPDRQSAGPSLVRPMPRLPNVPTVIDASPVALFSQIDERHEPTHECILVVNEDGEWGSAWGVAICATGDGAFVLFSCYDDWYPATATRHATMEEAVKRAEEQYDGLADTWEAPP